MTRDMLHDWNHTEHPAPCPLGASAPAPRPVGARPRPPAPGEPVGAGERSRHLRRHGQSPDRDPSNQDSLTQAIGKATTWYLVSARACEAFASAVSAVPRVAAFRESGNRAGGDCAGRSRRVLSLSGATVHLHHPRATRALARPHNYSQSFTRIETATEHMQHLRVNRKRYMFRLYKCRSPAGVLFLGAGGLPTLGCLCKALPNTEGPKGDWQKGRQGLPTLGCLCKALPNTEPETDRCLADGDLGKLKEFSEM